jgi:hypothetical protein
MCSNYAHHQHPRVRHRDYHGEVVYLGIFRPDNGGVYLVPMTDLPLKREGTLRVDPPKNNQQLRVRFANKYEIGRVHLHAPDSVQRVPRLGSVD